MFTSDLLSSPPQLQEGCGAAPQCPRRRHLPFISRRPRRRRLASLPNPPPVSSPHPRLQISSSLLPPGCDALPSPPPLLCRPDIPVICPSLVMLSQRLWFWPLCWWLRIKTGCPEMPLRIFFSVCMFAFTEYVRTVRAETSTFTDMWPESESQPVQSPHPPPARYCSLTCRIQSLWRKKDEVQAAFYSWYHWLIYPTWSKSFTVNWFCIATPTVHLTNKSFKVLLIVSRLQLLPRHHTSDASRCRFVHWLKLLLLTLAG